MENTVTNEEQNFLNDLGSMAPEGETTEPEETTEPAATEDVLAEEPNEGEESNSQEDQTEKPDPIDSLISEPKSNKAFAEMRVQNKKQQEMLNKISGVLGFDASKMSPEDLENTLNGVLTQAQAQQQNIPEEVLARLNNLEVINQKYVQEHLHANARNGLVLLRDKYGATQEQLETFVTDLTDDGMNPLENQIDFETEYIKRNFNNIVESKVQAALQTETERSTKAKAHASTPDTKKGGTPDSNEKINSVVELDAAFNKLTD